jgi:hypothetical protein
LAGKTGKVAVARRSVKGAAFWLTVVVPDRGRVTVTGAGITTAHKSMARAGTARMRVILTASEKRRLKRKHRLGLRLRVSFMPATGRASQVRLSITDRL